MRGTTPNEAKDALISINLSDTFGFTSTVQPSGPCILSPIVPGSRESNNSLWKGSCDKEDGSKVVSDHQMRHFRTVHPDGFDESMIEAEYGTLTTTDNFSMLYPLWCKSGPVL